MYDARVRALLLALLVIVLAACEPRLALGAGCEFNSDCAAPLVCRNARCRTACLEARDCPAGLRCVADGAGQTCTLPVEETCDAVTSPCPGALRCTLGQCRSECDLDSDCTASGRCEGGSCRELASGLDAGVPDAGAPDAACSAAPIVCGNARAERCDVGLDAIAAAMTGGTSGEAELLGPVELPAEIWPTLGGVPIAPEIALGLSAAGFGVVGQLAGGDAREVRLFSFSLADPSTAAPVALDRRDFGPPEPPISNALTLALTENGDEVMGFVLDREPASAGGVSGHQLTLALGGGVERPISAGDPPATSGGHTAIVGGASSVWGTDFPVYYLTRELRAPSGEPVLGAIDEDLSMSTYRSTSTIALGGASLLASASTAGGIAVFRAGGESVGIWNVERTTPLSMLGGVPPDDLRVADVDAAGDPAAELVAVGGLDYLLAVPVAPGHTRFFDLVCPAVGACNAPRARAGGELAARSASVPLEVRLASLPEGAHALASREAGASGGAHVELRFLDADLAPTAVELAAPIVAARADPARADVVAMDVRAVRDGTVVTVIVAALVRDVERREDRVVLAGVRACVAR